MRSAGQGGARGRYRLDAQRSGDKRNSYEQILDKLAPLAAGYSADASYEMTVISGRVHKDNLDRFLPLLSDAIREPAFRQDDLDRIKSQMLNYLENTLRYSSDEELGKAVFYNEVAKSIPDDYGHLPQGTIAGLARSALTTCGGSTAKITSSKMPCSDWPAATTTPRQQGCGNNWQCRR